MKRIGILKLIDDRIKGDNKILENKVAIVNLNENECNVFELNSLTLWRDILALRYDYLYVWDTTVIFAFLDAWANQEKLTNYNDIGLNENGYKAKCDCEAISYKDGEGAYYQRKLWLKTAKAGSTDRHKRLTATSFINFKNYFGNKSIEDILKAFKINLTTSTSKFLLPAYSMVELLKRFDKFIFEITGMRFIKSTGAPLAWTMGGISKAYYLRLYAPNALSPNRLYQERNIQSKGIEFELRTSNLLLPGLLYMKDKRLRNKCYKYDKNSLFPAAEKDLPFFGIPRKVPFNTVYTLEKTNKYEFIYLFKNLSLQLKPGKLPIFKEPNTLYHGKNKTNIFIENQAFFSFYYKLLSHFYYITFEDVQAYILLKTPDRAITKYVDSLYAYKTAAKRGEIDPGLYTVVKYLLNNLHGKFAQLTINAEYDYIRNKDGIVVKKEKEIKDNWENSHFDYIRGAWVYAKSQAIMLQDLIDLELQGHDLLKEIFYIDTDCLVTTISDIPTSDTQLGKYKLEGKFYQFKVYAPKTYFSINWDSCESSACKYAEYNLTVAGMQKKEIFDYLQKYYPYDNWFEVLSKIKLPNTILKRTPTGCEYVIEWRKLVVKYKDRSNKGVL